MRKFPKERAHGPRGFTRWLSPRMKGYLLACCDCCLVHELEFRAVGKDVQFRARRANGHTAALRKRMKKS